jgi:hypothetical protein
MSNQFQREFKNIEQRLEDLTKVINKKTRKSSIKLLCDEFQDYSELVLERLSIGEQGLIAFSQINSKIVYKIEDVNKMLDDNYQPL